MLKTPIEKAFEKYLQATDEQTRQEAWALFQDIIEQDFKIRRAKFKGEPHGQV